MNDIIVPTWDCKIIRKLATIASPFSMEDAAKVLCMYWSDCEMVLGRYEINGWISKTRSGSWVIGNHVLVYLKLKKQSYAQEIAEDIENFSGTQRQFKRMKILETVGDGVFTREFGEKMGYPTDQSVIVLSRMRGYGYLASSEVPGKTNFRWTLTDSGIETLNKFRSMYHAD